MRTLWFALLLVLTAPAPLSGQQADPKSDDEELRLFEEALAADAAATEKAAGSISIPTPPMRTGAQNLQSMNPNIALVLDSALAWFFDGEPIQVGAHDPNENGFNLQQLELHMDANVDPYFRLDANLVFTLFGVELEEAFLTTLGIPWGLQVRAGQFLHRIGRINATHPHAWFFADQPLVNGAFFGGEGSRGLGTELSWLTPLPWYVELVVSANQAAGAATARSFYGADDLGVDTPLDFLYTGALKQFFPMGRDWSLMWGLSGQFGPNSTGKGNRTEIYATDLYLRYRPRAHAGRMHVSLQVEGMLRTRQVPGDVILDWGGYAQLVWGINQRWETGARFDCLSGVPDDYLNPLADAWRDRTSLQITFYPSHFSRLRLQGSADRPTWRDEVTWGVMLAAEVLIGAHGAHKY